MVGGGDVIVVSPILLPHLPLSSSTPHRDRLRLSLSSSSPHRDRLRLSPHRPRNYTRISTRQRLILSYYLPASRLNGGRPRCSMADVQLNPIASQDTTEDNSLSAICAAAILDPTPLDFSSSKGSSFVDDILTSLPYIYICIAFREEEQTALAATPAHPTGLYALYANCMVGSLVEQLWSFAWPAAIALIHPSLLPVAVISFFTKFAITLGGPLVGKFMDRFPRLSAYNSLNFIQASAQLLSAMMIIHAHSVPSSTTSTILLRPWFLMLTLAGAVERLSGLALGVSIERDWVVLLAGTNRPIALAQANALISQIDLLCEIVGASLFGFLLSKYDPVSCLKLAAGLMMWSLPVSV